MQTAAAVAQSTPSISPSHTTMITSPLTTHSALPPANTPLSGSRTGSRTSTTHYRPPAVSKTTSSSSILFAEGEVDPITVEGLKHSEIKLHARQYKQTSFSTDLLRIFHDLCVPKWTDLAGSIDSQDVKVFKVSGSLTNAVFFISHLTLPSLPTVLLRVYGPSSGSLISRPRELHALHVLSSRYCIGPRVFGTFANGRVEEYFHSTTLTAHDIRKPHVSRWIGARMAELHSVDIDIVEGSTPASDDAYGNHKQGWEIAAKKNFLSWLQPANEVLALPNMPQEARLDMDLEQLEADWRKYMRWIAEHEKAEGPARRVFAHNDTQYGNLLRMSSLKPSTPEHRQIIVVDFEYAAPNPAPFDIANHFHEWTANYHGPTPHLLDASLYPTEAERHNFERAYLEHDASAADKTGPSSSSRPFASLSPEDQNAAVRMLDHQVRLWSPASHAMWAIWGIVQAREDLEGGVVEPEFDYIGYARCRLRLFRQGLRELGLL